MTLPLLSPWPDPPETEPSRPLRLAALDLSLTGTGTAATHTPDGRAELTVDTIRPRTDGHQRLQDIVTGVAALTRFTPQLVLLERLPLQYKHGATTVELYGLHMLIRQWLWTIGIPYLYVNPAHLKIYATGRGDGKGSAGKAAVLRAMQHRYPVYVEDDNQADALAMLCLALHAYGQPLTPVPDTHHRAVGMVQWPALDELTPRGAHLTPRQDPPPADVTSTPSAGAAGPVGRRS